MELSPEKQPEVQPSAEENVANQNAKEAQNTTQEQKLESSVTEKSQQPIQETKLAKQAITVKIFEQRLNQATQFKNNGNAFFKKRDFVGAIKQYSSGLKLLDPNLFYGATQAECQKMAELSSTLLCNMGFSYFNSFDMGRAELFLNQAIIINPKYVKALHKRALARFQLEKYEQSFEDIKQAFNLDKTNAEIHQAYSKILQKYNQIKKKNNEKMKQLSSKIFSNDSLKGSSPKKQPKNDNQQKDKKQEKSWSWPSIIAFAGAATFIGAGIFKAIKG